MHSVTVGLAVIAAMLFGAEAMTRRQAMASSMAPVSSGSSMGPSSPTTQGPTSGMSSTDSSSTPAPPSTMTTMTIDAGGDGGVDAGTTAPVVTTPAPIAVVCNKSADSVQAVMDNTNTPAFRELPDNEQILVYELLAAGEGCKMAPFINAETAERIFRLLGDLPLRYVYTLVKFLAASLQNEGVSVPV